MTTWQWYGNSHISKALVMDPNPQSSTTGKEPNKHLITNPAQKAKWKYRPSAATQLAHDNQNAKMGLKWKTSRGSYDAKQHKLKKEHEDVHHKRIRGHWSLQLIPSAQSIREIKFYQQSVILLVAIAPFTRLAWEVAEDFKTDLQFQTATIFGLQEVSKAYLVSLFKDSCLYAIHGKRVHTWVC